MNVCVAQRNRRSISFLTWRSPRMMTTMMTTMMRKRSAHRMMTNRPPVPQTSTHQQEGIQAAVGTPSWVLLNLRPRALKRTLVRNPPQGEFGQAGEPPLQAAGEHCSPGRLGRLHQELFPPAVRAVPQAAASPQGRRCPHPADMSHCLLREDHLPSDPFPLFILFPIVAIRHPKQGPLPPHSGYSTGPLDTSHGRAQVQRVVMSNR